MQTKERELFIDEEIVRHDIRRIKALRDCKSTNVRLGRFL